MSKRHPCPLMSVLASLMLTIDFFRIQPSILAPYEPAPSQYSAIPPSDT